MDGAPLVVSFWTNVRYQDHARGLEASCKALELPYRIVQRPHGRDFNLNIHQKTGVVLEALEDFPDFNVLWVDADAKLRARPELVYAPVNFDFAAVRTRMGWCGGTLFFRNSEPARELLAEWIGENNRRPDLWDQTNLGPAVLRVRRRLGPAFRLLELPPAYNWIERFFRFAHRDAKPVVEHFAISQNPAHQNTPASAFETEPLP